MMTGVGSEALAVEAFRRGAADYVVKENGYLEELTERVRALVNGQGELP
jgi:DNA-binding response OmpR family regulator